MNNDVTIIGGGLAGLSLSIDLKKRGYRVAVIEKGNYPRHKVCGEYISLESYNYLYSICPALADYNLPQINSFKLTSTSKSEFSTTLDLGGFGISRYLLENLLFIEAQKKGVHFILNDRAQSIHWDSSEKLYTVKTNTSAFSASLVCNASGKKSNFETKEKTGTNYIGVKYHVKVKRNPGVIEIHNFPGGYCGISNIEEDKSCLCYIVNAENLKSVHNSIHQLEKVFLFRNNNLRELFNMAEFLFKEPVTISGINFLIKKPVSDDTFFLGDSAGSIAPITGNGMSMALRTASVLAARIDDYFTGRNTKQQLIENYSGFWNNEFASRIKLSRHFQKLSEYPFLTNTTIALFNLFPALATTVIKQTHGRPF